MVGFDNRRIATRERFANGRHYTAHICCKAYFYIAGFQRIAYGCGAVVRSGKSTDGNIADFYFKISAIKIQLAQKSRGGILYQRAGGKLLHVCGDMIVFCNHFKPFCVVNMFVSHKYRTYVRKRKAQRLQGFFGTSCAYPAIYEKARAFGMYKEAVSRRSRKKRICFQDENPFFTASNHHDAISQKRGKITAIIINESTFTAFLRFGTLRRKASFLSAPHESGRSSSVGSTPRCMPAFIITIAQTSKATTIVYISITGIYICLPAFSESLTESSVSPK